MTTTELILMLLLVFRTDNTGRTWCYTTGCGDLLWRFANLETVS